MRSLSLMVLLLGACSSLRPAITAYTPEELARAPTFNLKRTRLSGKLIQLTPDFFQTHPRHALEGLRYRVCLEPHKGRVIGVRPVYGLPDLDDAAGEALRTWTWNIELPGYIQEPFCLLESFPASTVVLEAPAEAAAVTARGFRWPVMHGEDSVSPGRYRVCIERADGRVASIEALGPRPKGSALAQRFLRDAAWVVEAPAGTGPACFEHEFRGGGASLDDTFQPPIVRAGRLIPVRLSRVRLKRLPDASKPSVTEASTAYFYYLNFPLAAIYELCIDRQSGVPREVRTVVSLPVKENERMVARMKAWRFSVEAPPEFTEICSPWNLELRAIRGN